MSPRPGQLPTISGTFPFAHLNFMSSLRHPSTSDGGVDDWECSDAFEEPQPFGFPHCKKIGLVASVHVGANHDVCSFLTQFSTSATLIFATQGLVRQALGRKDPFHRPYKCQTVHIFAVSTAVVSASSRWKRLRRRLLFPRLSALKARLCRSLKHESQPSLHLCLRS